MKLIEQKTSEKIDDKKEAKSNWREAKLNTTYLRNPTNHQNNNDQNPKPIKTQFLKGQKRKRRESNTDKEHPPPIEAY